MPRNPEEYPTALCARFNNGALVLRVVTTAYGLLPSAFCILLLFTTYHSSLTTVYAQTATATLSGTVTDPNGAVIAGVNIAVINIAQGFERSTVTNSEGTFVVPLLTPGKYTVKAEHEGFSTSELSEVVLNVNDQVRITIRLSVGNISQTVLIEGGSPIDESPAVGTTVDRQFVGNLPLNGRSFQSLITLSPGVVITKSDFNEPGQFSVNGQRANANYFTVDGVSANIAAPTGLVPGQTGTGSLPGFTTFGGTNNLISVDALEEFKIQTSSYSAEFGRTPGAQISLLSRSGTNEFHGTVFEYFRNDALDANDWFANSRGLAKPPLRQNNFGGVLGGPVLLPRFGEGGTQPGYNGRNGTFFFFSYEGLRLRQPLTGITDVPSRAARVNPAASAAIRQILNAFPLPTGPDLANGFAEFAASFSNPTTLNATSFRIDHTFNKKLIVFGRFNYAPSESVTRAGDNGRQSLNTIRVLRSGTETLTSGATFIINPTITNDLRFNFSRTTNGGFFTLDDFGGAVPVADSLLFPPFTSRTLAVTNLAISGGRNTGLLIGNGTTNRQRQINLIDNLSIVRGSHLLKFGVDYRRLSPILAPRSYGQFVNFNGITNVLNGAVSGTAQSVGIENNSGPQNPIFTNLSIYGQDTWKANSRLNITYGLRWELNPVPHEANGNDAYTLISLGDPGSLALAPRGTDLWKTTYNNFAPRIGIAYQLSQNPGKETVLRGGFGVFYDIGNGVINNAFTNTWPFTSAKTLSNVPFPLSLTNATPAPVNSNPPPTTGIVLFDPHLKLPYTYQWNFAIEQSLGSNQTFSASYVASAGRRLLRQNTLRFGMGTVFSNPNFPQEIVVTENAATSDYQSMQLQFQRRLSRRLQALVGYTWGHSIDIASSDSGFSAPQTVVNIKNDRGPSDFDVRHALTGAITYEIPAPNTGAFGKSLLHNWAIDSTFTFRSATPVNVLIQSLTSGFGFYFLRPNLIQGVPLYLSDTTVGGGKRINPAAFSLPPPGRQGSLGRNALRGFPVSQIDLALRRQFNLTERVNLQFRTDFFNILNHPNFGDPSATDSFWGLDIFGAFFIANPTFGRSSSMLGRRLGSGGNSGGFNPLYQIGGPRSIQFSLKLGF